MNGKKPRMTTHVDVSKRKAATKKRKYDVAFGADVDPNYQRPFFKAKRIKPSLGPNDQKSGGADDKSVNSFKSADDGKKTGPTLVDPKKQAVNFSQGEIPVINHRPFNGHPNQVNQ